MSSVVMPLFLIWCVCGFAGGMIGKSKNAVSEGVMLGFFLGPIGVLVAAVALDKRHQCQYCHGRLNGYPRVCQHCGSDLRPTETKNQTLPPAKTADFAEEQKYVDRMRQKREGRG